MVEVLTRKESYSSIFNKLPKRIYFKPIHIGKANWRLSDSENYDFELVFDKLYHDSDLSKEDLEYMKSQYVSTNETTWNFKHKKLKLKKRHRAGDYQYSVPLFTRDGTRAIMWRYKYCGSLCAYSELHMYNLKNGKWEITELIHGWMS
jgi:hypothetical protein